MCAGERRHVARRRTRSPASCSVTSSAAPDLRAGDDRQPAGHGLQRRVGKRIVDRRQHEGIGGAVEGRRRPVCGPANVDALAHAERARQALVARPCACRRPTIMRCAGSGNCASAAMRRRHALARVSPNRPAGTAWRPPGSCICARMRSRCSRSAGMERVRVDGVVDHRQALVGEAEARLDLVAHHLRIADHGAQPRAREQLPLHAPACSGATGSARRAGAPMPTRRAAAPRARRRARRRRRGRCRSRARARATARGWRLVVPMARQTARAKPQSRHRLPR